MDGSTSELARQVEAATGVLAERWSETPRAGIILGTGLGGLADEISEAVAVNYEDVPHLPSSTALSHCGQFVCGRLRGTPNIAAQGRLHAYEGYSPSQITLPVRVMHRLGVERLIVCNAAGALNPLYRVGDLMIIDDHINLMWGLGTGVWGTSEPRPLGSGPSDEQPLTNVRGFELRSPHFYDPALIEATLAVSRRNDIVCHRGTYVAMRGPNYETRAEYRFVRQIGGDAVGMSTVPEVIVAAQLGLRVLALSTITNVCRPDALGQTQGEEVIAAAAAAEHKLRTIVLGIVEDKRL